MTPYDTRGSDMSGISGILATNFGQSAGISADLGRVWIARPMTVKAGRSMTLIIWIPAGRGAPPPAVVERGTPVSTRISARFVPEIAALRVGQRLDVVAVPHHRVAGRQRQCVQDRRAALQQLVQPHRFQVFRLWRWRGASILGRADVPAGIFSTRWLAIRKDARLVQHTLAYHQLLVEAAWHRLE